VLERVTLAKMVELVVKVLIDFATSTILDEKTAENSETTHPYDLAWHTSISRTLSLSETAVSTNSSCSSELTGAGSGVHGDWLANDEAICDELSDGLSGVGIGFR